MVASLRIQADTDVLEALEEAIEKAPRTVNVVINQRILGDLYQRILTLVGPYPGSPRYPIRWKSERQRRYVMAKLRREGNLPYRRSNRLQQSWEVEAKGLPDGVEITATNTAQDSEGTFYAQYVVFEDQQPFHADTGWPRADFIGEQLADELADELIDLYFEVIDQPPGSRFA
jgi:hypothetical protein